MKRNMGTDTDRHRVKELLKKESQAWRKTRLLALKLGFSADNNIEHIADVLDCNRATVQRWFSQYRKDGLDALLTRQHKGRTSSKYDSDVRAFLNQGLEAGRWASAVQAQQDLEKHFKRKFNYKSVWYWLKKCAGVIRVPRPVHEKRDSSRAEAFKRCFYGKLRALPIAKGKPVKIWFCDESRYGLLSHLRRCWTRKRLRQIKRCNSRYEWSYCYGALDVVDGDAVFLQTPSVNLDWTECFLKELTKAYPQHEHIVVWDGAGFHPRDNSHEQVPEHVHILMLPAYSPELNPIEKLWDTIQDYTTNKLWPNLDRLDQVVGSLLKDWWEEPQKILSLFGKNWHRASANDSVPGDMLILY